MPRRALLVITAAIAVVGVVIAGGYEPSTLGAPATQATNAPDSTTIVPSDPTTGASISDSRSTGPKLAASTVSAQPSRTTVLAERRVASPDDSEDDGSDDSSRGDLADRSSTGTGDTEAPQTAADGGTATDEPSDSSDSTGSTAATGSGEPSDDGPEAAESTPTSTPAAEPTTEPPTEPTPAPETATPASTTIPEPTGASETTAAPETITEPATPSQSNDTTAASPDGPTQIDSCTIIDEPGTYELTADVSDSSATVCIEINASDVVLDGAGHVVDGTDANETVGLLVRTDEASVSNVTVRDLVVRDWDDGVRASAFEPDRFTTVYGEDLIDARFEGVTSASNLGAGFRLFEAERVVVTESGVEENGGIGVSFRSFGENDSITDSSIADNGGVGIHAYEGGSDLAIENNTISGNAGDGVRVQNDAYRTELADNVVTGNGQAGIALSTSWSATIAGNRIESNGGPGILAGDSGNDRIVDNAVEGNGADGILLDWANDNRVERNDVRQNAGAGIALRESHDNELLTNVVCDNDGATQILVGSDSTGNVVENNTVACA